MIRNAIIHRVEPDVIGTIQRRGEPAEQQIGAIGKRTIDDRPVTRCRRAVPFVDDQQLDSTGEAFENTIKATALVAYTLETMAQG